MTNKALSGLSDAVDLKQQMKGHRERLRTRFLKGGADSLHDYELLELYLFRTIPRRDTKPLAKKLIDHFGSFAEAIHAPDHLLREVPGMGDAVITDFRLLSAASLQLVRSEAVKKTVLNSWDELIDYCRAAMAYESREQFRIIFLDKRNKVIADEVQQTGTVDHTPVYIREITKRTLELSATAIILVHNHPSGDPSPSRADIDMTKQIDTVAKGLGIVVHDHIIIAKEGYSSLKALGLF